MGKKTNRFSNRYRHVVYPGCPKIFTLEDILNCFYHHSLSNKPNDADNGKENGNYGNHGNDGFPYPAQREIKKKPFDSHLDPLFPLVDAIEMGSVFEPTLFVFLLARIENCLWFSKDPSTRTSQLESCSDPSVRKQCNLWN